MRQFQHPGRKKHTECRRRDLCERIWGKISQVRYGGQTLHIYDVVQAGRIQVRSGMDIPVACCGIVWVHGKIRSL